MCDGAFIGQTFYESQILIEDSTRNLRHKKMCIVTFDCCLIDFARVLLKTGSLVCCTKFELNNHMCLAYLLYLIVRVDQLEVFEESS